MKPISDYNTRLETFCVQHSGLSLLNPSTEKALTSIFISRLQSELSSLIQRHKLDWKAAPLTELAEHFEKKLVEQAKIFKPVTWPHSYNSSKGQQDLHIHIPSQNVQVPHSGTLPWNLCLHCKQPGYWNRECPYRTRPLIDLHLLPDCSSRKEVLKELISILIIIINGAPRDPLESCSSW